MTGYFGALMRASGMAIAGRVPPVAPAGPRTMEIDAERNADALPEPSARTAPTPAPIESPARPATVVESRASNVIRTDAPVEMPAPIATDPARPPVPVREDEPPAVRVAEPPKPVLAQTLIQAAMKWVAADTDVRRVAPAASVPEPVAPVPARGESLTITSTNRHEREASFESPRTNHTAAIIPSADHVVAREAIATPVAATRSTAVAMPATIAPPAAAPRDEVIEVSIGAIHVRVDASAAQTIARPAPPTPQPRRTANPALQRSGLARRSLRRI